MKKFITLIIAIAMIATLATGCGVDTPAEDVFNKYDKDTTITETEKDSADKSDDKDDDKSDSDKKDESDKKDDNKSESDKKDDDKVADNKPADNADKNNGSKPSGSGSTNSNTGSKPSGGNSNSGSKPSGGNTNTGSKPSGGNTNQSKPVEQPKPSHSHSYAVVSQTGATCTAAGVTTYKCSCGDSYTEQNSGALGHAWQTQYNEWDEVVHHPGTVVTTIVCECGQTFNSDNERTVHNRQLILQGLGGHSFSTDEKEVGGYDETVHHSDPCGQKCTRCGANG